MRQDAPLITVSHLLRILRARWLTISMMTAMAVAAGVAATLLLPKRYVATATVLVDVKSPDPLNGLFSQGMMSPSYMNTQVDLIGSDRVARRVVREMRLGEDSETLNLWKSSTQGEGDLEAWLAEWLGKGLEVKSTRETNLVQVTYRSQNPDFAAKAANAFVKAYIDTTLELRVAPARQYKDFFDTSARQLREDLETAQRNLSAFQQKNGLIGNEEALDIEAARLNALVAQLVLMQSQASDSGSRQAQASSGDRTQEALASPLVSGLRADLQRNRTRLSELESTLGDNHPQVQQLRANIAELNTRITEETNRVVGGVRVNNAVNQQRLAELQAEVDRQRAKILRVKSTRDEATVLKRDVESAQKNYDGVLARASQMGLESQAGQTNVLMIGMATVPSRADSPKPLRNIASAVFLGLLGGLLLALINEARDQRIRTDDQAAALLRQPIVTVVPRFKHRATASSASANAPATRARRLLSS